MQRLVRAAHTQRVGRPNPFQANAEPRKKGNEYDQGKAIYCKYQPKCRPPTLSIDPMGRGTAGPVAIIRPEFLTFGPVDIAIPDVRAFWSPYFPE